MQGEPRQNTQCQLLCGLQTAVYGNLFRVDHDSHPEIKSPFGYAKINRYASHCDSEIG